MLTHFICLKWVKYLSTSILYFDIVQFFHSLNYQILSLILLKASFDYKVLFFFWDYLVGRKTSYF